VPADRFHEAYEGRPPWDIGAPQPVVVRLADAGEVAGPVLDAGCGTGENSLFLAGRGFEVVGVDAVLKAVEAARHKATARGLQAEFLVADALDLAGLGRRFATVVDSGLFHTFDDDERGHYLTSLAAVTLPGARLFVLCFSEHETREGGPRRITRDELHAAFHRPPFRLLDIEAVEMATLLDGEGRRCWLARVERLGTATGPDSDA
jgi:SAM-dependent methyltransferase